MDQGTKNIIIIWQKMKQQDMLINLRRTAKSCTHRAYHYLNQDLKIRILRWQWSQRVHSCFVRYRCNNLSHPRYICLELFIRKTCWFIRATKISCQLKHSLTFNQAQYKQPVIDSKKKKKNRIIFPYVSSFQTVNSRWNKSMFMKTSLGLKHFNVAIIKFKKIKPKERKEGLPVTLTWVFRYMHWIPNC